MLWELFEVGKIKKGINNKRAWALASMVQLVEHHPMYQKAACWIPAQGTCPGIAGLIPSRGHAGGNRFMFLSLPVPLSQIN